MGLERALAVEQGPGAVFREGFLAEFEEQGARGGRIVLVQHHVQAIKRASKQRTTMSQW